MCLGSFLNVVVERVIHEQTIFDKSRSKCESCGHTLGVWDLIPIFSYIFLRGRCRYCHEKYGAYNLISETLFSFSFVTLFLLNKEDIPKAIFECILFCILYCIYYIDNKTMDIYDVFLYMIGVLAIINIFAFKSITIKEALIGMVAISLPMFILVLIIPEAFGIGDIKLFAFAGLMLGWKNILLTFFISLIAATLFIIYKKLKYKTLEDQHIPFGPSITIGIFLSMLFGSQIISWYLSFFF